VVFHRENRPRTKFKVRDANIESYTPTLIRKQSRIRAQDWITSSTFSAGEGS
jgi:hypothetical protein